MSSESATPAQVLECAVCWSETAEDDFAVLPCHATPSDSTMRYCRRCVEIICESSPGGVGRCPTCRAFLRVRQGGGFEVADRVEMCTLCRQAKLIVTELRPGVPVCDACLLGAQNPLRYECERCNRVQHIPHPMYRYQVEGPNAYGNDTWACQQRCGDYTRWRVHQSDVHLVPPQDAPESWGVADDFIAQVREQRRRELAMGGLVMPGWAGGRNTNGDVGRRARSELWQLVVPVGLLAAAKWLGWL